MVFFDHGCRGEDVVLLASSMDCEYYIRQAGIEQKCDVEDVARHYLKKGWKRGLDPSRWFSTTHYLELNKDVRESGVNPYLHYLKHGRKEGRHVFPSSWGDNLESIREIIRHSFDEEYYLSQCVGKEEINGDPILHYILYGWHKGYDPEPGFSTSYYLDSNPDVKESGVNPYLHYLEFGGEEGRLPRRRGGEEVKSTDLSSESEKSVEGLQHENSVLKENASRLRDLLDEWQKKYGEMKEERDEIYSRFVETERVAGELGSRIDFLENDLTAKDVAIGKMREEIDKLTKELESYREE